MTDHTFKTRSAPRLTVIPRARMSGPEEQTAHWVRAYRQSPEDVYLQMRWKGRYVGVSLTFQEARELGRHLIAESFPTEEGR